MSSVCKWRATALQGAAMIAAKDCFVAGVAREGPLPFTPPTQPTSLLPPVSQQLKDAACITVHQARTHTVLANEKVGMYKPKVTAQLPSVNGSTFPLMHNVSTLAHAYTRAQARTQTHSHLHIAHLGAKQHGPCMRPEHSSRRLHGAHRALHRRNVRVAGQQRVRKARNLKVQARQRRRVAGQRQVGRVLHHCNNGSRTLGLQVMGFPSRACCCCRLLLLLLLLLLLGVLMLEGLQGKLRV